MRLKPPSPPTAAKFTVKPWNRFPIGKPKSAAPKSSSWWVMAAQPDQRARYPSLAGKRVLVTAGGTREPLDSVRFLGNRSSGKMGVALADEALARGADVTTILSNAQVRPLGGVQIEAMMSGIRGYAFVIPKASQPVRLPPFWR